jgi:hypothetical protein
MTHKLESALPENQSSDDPIEYYWRKSRAINHLSDAVQELESLLHQLIPIRTLHADLELRGKNREKNHDLDKTADGEFGAITDEFWALEEKICLKTDMICLMSAIQTEDNLNAFIVFNCNEVSGSKLDQMGKKDKIKQVLKVGGDDPKKNTVINSYFTILKEWRDAFAHGHRTTDLSIKSVRDNHQRRPDEYINVPMELRKAIDLANAFLSIDDYLRSISEHQFTRRCCKDTVTIGYNLEKIKRFIVEGNGNDYTISFLGE